MLNHLYKIIKSDKEIIYNFYNLLKDVLLMNQRIYIHFIYHSSL